ncbi:NAD(P)/FAD-dependent oxidoreductase [Nocardiopsis sp. JB363]|uniref:NAD(P)/FAD-dependent oxidoreductase n=1 Tax=Nocardiopsis sp. JB363 TaxID=1434837 RepID=UPI00097A5DD2|nr:FAD-dependent oxidoreductase [Nocardiopsis sp. JB363]SIO89148.1 NADH dehydrogenase [Nocardiopsis sp. JB363]
MAHELLVLGAGYAGLAAAGRAAHHARTRSLDLRVTLVNAAPDFVERVRLHQVAAGQDVGTHPLTEPLHDTEVDLILGRVESLDPRARTVDVHTEEGPRALRYDTLVYALGSDAAPAPVPGVAEYTHDTASLTAARRLADHVRRNPPRTLAVVGGGLTGVEVATEFAENHPDLRVELITRGRVGTGVGDRGRAHLHRVLNRLGVTVREHTGVTEVDAAGLSLDGGGRVDADVVVWNAGFGVLGPLATAGPTVDDSGRALVDADQRSVSHPEILVVGDAAHARAVDGRQLRMSCAMGLPMGWSAADTVADSLGGRPSASGAGSRARSADPRPTDHGPGFGYLFQCVSLGRRDGLIQFVRGDDTPTRFVLTGRLAALYKEFIVAGAYDGLRGGQTQPNLYLRLVRWSGRRFLRRVPAESAALPA